MPDPEIDLTRTYDAVVIGSGAAGGMAAHVLTSRGLKVLMLEAGKNLPIEKELRSMQWPYDNPNREALRPDHHSLTFNEYTIRNPPYGPGFEKSKHLHSYVGNTDYVKNIVVDERENPFTGTNYAWVRARCCRWEDKHLGTPGAQALRLRFQGQEPRWLWGRLADQLQRHRSLLRQGGFVPRHHRREGKPSLSSRRHISAPTKLNCAELTLKQGVQKMGRVLTQYRAGVTTDGLQHNQYRSRCFGRGACERKGGCDIHAAFDSPTGLIYPAADTGTWPSADAVVREVTVDPQTGNASGVHFIDSETMKDYTVRAKVVIVAASTLESARLLLLSKSRLYPNGLANSSSHVGHNFCEHIMGPGVTGQAKDLVGKPSTLDDGRPGGFYLTDFGT